MFRRQLILIWLVVLSCSIIVDGDFLGSHNLFGQEVVGHNTKLWQWTAPQTHHNAIVQVSLDNGVGTGIIVYVDRTKPVRNGYEGWCLTANHVVSDDKGRRDIRIRYRDGQGAKNCKILAADEKNDVAILWVWVPSSIQPVSIAPTAAGPKTMLEFCGLGGGSQLQCCVRHFSAAASDPTNAQVIFADVALLPGDSGGPVFNDQKQVVGIISGGWFWWDGGVKNDDGTDIRATWPARASNLQPIADLVTKIQLDKHDLASK